MTPLTRTTPLIVLALLGGGVWPFTLHAFLPAVIEGWFAVAGMVIFAGGLFLGTASSMTFGVPMDNRRGLLPHMLVLAALFGVGAVGCSPEAQSPAKKQESRTLSIDEARDSLIEFVRSGDNHVLKMSLPVLESATPSPLESGWTAIGPWRVHLEGREFIVSVDGTAQFEEYAGVFRYDQGSWRAQVDYEVRASDGEWP